MASTSSIDPATLNVLQAPLEIHGKDPITGFFRDGYCRPSRQDPGNHTLAGVLTQDFLEFSKSRGNDLMTPRGGFPGLKEGCRWCLCVERWKEALIAAKDHPKGEKIVPQVSLEATSLAALSSVPLTELQKYKWTGEKTGSGSVKVGA